METAAAILLGLLFCAVVIDGAWRWWCNKRGKWGP